MKRLDLEAVARLSKKVKLDEPEPVDAVLALPPEGILVEAVAEPEESCYARLGDKIEVYGVQTAQGVYQLQVNLPGTGKQLTTLEIRPNNAWKQISILEWLPRRAVSPAAIGLLLVLFAAKMRRNWIRKSVDKANNISTRNDAVAIAMCGGPGPGIELQECSVCEDHCWIPVEEDLCSWCKHKPPPTLYQMASKRASSLQTRGIKSRVVEPLQLLTKYETSCGRCDYSHKTIKWGSRNDWEVSVERVDSSKPYHYNNITLVAKIFNVMEKKGSKPPNAAGSWQWSRSKFLQVLPLGQSTVDLDILKLELERARMTALPKAAEKTWFPLKNFVDTHVCSVCKIGKSADNYPAVWTKDGFEKAGHCVDCDSLAFYCSKILKGKHYASDMTEPITLDHVLDRILEQGGRCIVSRIPLSLQPFTDWEICPRKIDPTLPWSPSNFEFICREFHLVVSPKSKTASPRWTADMFNEVWFVN